jgi:uncharacterized protein (TIGR03083 family)
MTKDTVTDSDETCRIPLPDKAKAAAQVEAAMAQFCELLLTLDDLDRPAVGHWSVVDVAAHIAVGVELYTSIVAGKGSPISSMAPEAIAEVSDRLNAEITDRDPGVLVERIRIGAKTLTSTALARDGDPAVPFHAGIPMPVSAILGISVGEALVHGYDVARAYRRRWSMPADWVYTAFRGVLPIVHLCLDPDRAEGARARFDIRLRGDGGPRAVLSIADGQLDVRPVAPGTTADCYTRRHCCSCSTADAGPSSPP